MATIGERIKEARLNKGLKQDELAVMIGEKPKGVLSNWENGKNRPNAEQIIRLCKVLEVSPSYLLDFNAKQNEMLTLSEKRLVDLFRSLDDIGREHVFGIIVHEIDRLQEIEESRKSWATPVAAHSRTDYADEDDFCE